MKILEYAEFIPPSDKAKYQQIRQAIERARWLKRNVHGHKAPGYAAVTVSLKATGSAPGDITADQMDAVADMADRFGFGELRVSHEQNLILADVRQRDLFPLWQQLDLLYLATPNIGLLTNIISCPGGDFCSLANAVSIPLAKAIQERFDQLDYLHDIGELDLNVSGCINACGHHHIGHIGILGVDKAGQEWYQVTIGGRQNGASGAGGRRGRGNRTHHRAVVRARRCTGSNCEINRHLSGAARQRVRALH